MPEDIQCFSSVDEMIDYVTQLRDTGIEQYAAMPQRVKDLLKVGNHFMMPTDLGFCIFGEIIESEYDEDRKALSAEPHLRFVRAYSVACVEGELGTQFASNLLPISNAMFTDAKDRKWDLSYQEIVAALVLGCPHGEN